MWNSLARWSTSCNQNCWEKYQKPQICRWHHPNGRKWRGTEEPFDEGIREEWKSWLKTQRWKNKDHGIQSHHTMADRWGRNGNSDRLYIFLGSKITVDSDCSHEINRCLLLGVKAMKNLDSVLKSRDITLSTKVHIVKLNGFSISHVWMWELDQKEGWVQKNWCFKTVVLEKTLESPLDCKEVRLVNPKGNQLWIFIGRTDAEAETPILWPPDAKCWLIGNHPDDGKVWGQEDKGATEDKTVGWHNQFSGCEFEQTLRDSEGWGSLACCSPGKELDTTEQKWPHILLMLSGKHNFIL